MWMITYSFPDIGHHIKCVVTKLTPYNFKIEKDKEYSDINGRNYKCIILNFYRLTDEEINQYLEHHNEV